MLGFVKLWVRFVPTTLLKFCGYKKWMAILKMIKMDIVEIIYKVLRETLGFIIAKTSCQRFPENKISP